jgi:chromate reductase, NAD(P)H dehydrogenase (quinone)
VRSFESTEIPFKELPLYSYDYDTNYPPVATAFKEAILAADAVLFVTPEYNRSIPGALKNAIDWASRPYGTNAFTRKPSAVIGTSPVRSAPPSGNSICAAFSRFAIRRR